MRRPDASDFSELKLSLPARSENLSRVRTAVADFAASLGADENLIGNLRLAVNEAVTNVVRHAYAGEGEISLEARPVAGRLVVVVTDTGRGLSHASEDPGSGLGLRVASAVSDSMEVRGRGTGTEVRLAFPLPEDSAA